MLNWYLFLSGFQFLVEIIAYDIYPPVFLCCRHQNNKYSLELFDRINSVPQFGEFQSSRLAS